jgi:hypothetical protein
MIKYKVKYNRHEYREEYLKSDDWKTLRSQVLDIKPLCQCCQKITASDVHHMVYRNIVDVKITDLLPVCRSCHEYIHTAIDDGYISQDVKDLENIKIKTFNILNDEEYKAYNIWLRTKHNLSTSEINYIKNAQTFVIRKISGIMRKNIWYDVLPDMTFTGRQIEAIRKVIQLSVYRNHMKNSPKMSIPVKELTEEEKLKKINKEKDRLLKKEKERILRNEDLRQKRKVKVQEYYNIRKKKSSDETMKEPKKEKIKNKSQTKREHLKQFWEENKDLIPKTVFKY